MTAMPHPREEADRSAHEAQVLGKATLRAAEALGLTNAVLARVLGLSEPTVSRLKGGNWCFARGTKPFELAQLFLRLFRGLDAITGGDDVASRSWLRSDNLALGGRRPIDLIQTIAGLMAAVSYVDARRAVV